MNVQGIAYVIIFKYYALYKVSLNKTKQQSHVIA